MSGAVNQLFAAAYGVLISEMLYLAAVAAIGLIATFLVVCRKYEEGVIGNFFLGLLIIVCALELADALDGVFEAPAPTVRVMVVCAAVVIVRHAYRFAMFHWHGWFGWKKPADMDVRPPASVA